MFTNNGLTIKKTNNKETAVVLQKIVAAARELNPLFLSSKKGYRATTHLEFPQNWGLGSSSTLINNIAQWANVNPYKLLWNSFSGSGYDIACAQNSYPITYQLKNEQPIIKSIDFNPLFKNQLYFIHLNKKQNSREGIAKYREYKGDKTDVIKRISTISKEMIVCNQLHYFDKLIEEHENLISSIIKLPKIKDALFPNYPGAIKSLGAWGGDFILATGNEQTPSYFKEKGYTTVIPYVDMI